MTSYDYYYEEGMTWREWINSRYNNNDRCEIKIEDIYLDGGYKECIIGDLGFGRFIFIVTEDTEQFLDSLVYPAGLFGNHLLSIKTEEISQFYGQKWQNVWNDPSFIAYKEKYNLIIIDEEHRNTWS